MPLFEYACAGCGGRFEELVPRADAPAPPCPSCGGTDVRRLLSTFAVAPPRANVPPGPCGSDDCACRRAS